MKIIVHLVQNFSFSHLNW